MTNPQRIQTFGRKFGRKMRPEKKQLLDELLPTLAISPESLPQESVLSAYSFFGDQIKHVHLEIGFGNGEHLVWRAANEPDIGFIGCEVFMQGVAMCLSHLQQAAPTHAEGSGNVRLFTEDARLILDALDNNTLDRIYILFPDPWPKVRHHKRRIVNQELLDMASRVLKDGGELHLATDHWDYAQWILVHFQQRADFIWKAQSKKDWETPPQGHNKTRYEVKQKDGHEPIFLQFVRRDFPL